MGGDDLVTRVILALDPGLATGACALSIEDGAEPVLLETAELEEHEVAPWLRGWLEQHPDAIVACERFTINADTHKKSQAHWSLELIGVVKQCLRDIDRDPGTDLKMQTPADAKNIFPNPALKKLGYWHVGGGGHALDAIRHALLRLVKSNLWQPRRLLS